MIAFNPENNIFSRAVVLQLMSSVIGIAIRILIAALFLFLLPQLVTPLIVSGQPPYFAQFGVAVTGFLLMIELYLRTRLVNWPGQPKLSQADLASANLADFFTVSLAKDVLKAKKMAGEDHYASLCPSHLFLQIAKSDHAKWICQKIGLDLETLVVGAKAEIEKKSSQNDSQTFEKVIEQSAAFAKSENHDHIDQIDVLVALFAIDNYLAKAIFDIGLKIEDLQNIVFWRRRIIAEKKSANNIFNLTTFNRFAGLGYQWAAGYTLTLRQFSTDLTAITSAGNYHLVGRDEEVVEIEQILAKDKRANVLIVGESGVGKTSIVQKLALKSITGRTIPAIRFKRVLLLSSGNLLAGVTKVGEIEDRLSNILEEACHAGNVILYIEELQNLTGAVIGTDVVDLSSILLPVLQGDRLRIIATCTPANYHRFIETRSTLNSTFAKVEVKQPTADEAIRTLEEAVQSLEHRHQVNITYLAIKRIIELSNRYLPDRSLPGKAIDFLDELVIAVGSKSPGTVDVTAEQVEAMLTAKTGIPLAAAGKDEKERLLNLESVLHQRVIGQNEAISAVANALRRARSGLRETNRPIGSFLFLGPTGVGKTETAKAVAQAYFGSDKTMIRLDMSEFQHPDSVFGITGGIGKDTAQTQYLSQAVRENPYNLILLDELEKAHPKILELFLQIIDEGRLTDATGRLADFTNCIIIATSNAGAEQIRQAIINKQSLTTLREQLIDNLQKNNIFKTEFLNRFDEIILFKPLTVDQVVKVVELLIGQLDQRLQQKDISLAVTNEAKQKVAQLGYDPVFGARSLRRFLQEKIESVLAKKMLSGSIKRGETVKIDVSDLELHTSPIGT